MINQVQILLIYSLGCPLVHRDFAILIPTRNRPAKIAKLLGSIIVSNIKPLQIIIVASGEDIWPTISTFSDQLPITYLHTLSVGQIAQKRIGISMIKPAAEWCLFMDDDLLLEPSSIAHAFEAIEAQGSNAVIGLGLSLPPTTRTNNANFVTRLIASFIGINTEPSGKVFRSGHASSYLQEKEIIEAQWLNGASLWRSKYLDTYGKGFPSTRYAACEDLIFSYPLSKLGKLVYAPNARLQFQESELSNFDSLEVMEAAAYWRLYFVTQHKELSAWAFAFSQIGRAIFAITRTKENKLLFFFGMARIEFRIIISILRKSDPRDLLNRLVN